MINLFGFVFPISILVYNKINNDNFNLLLA